MIGWRGRTERVFFLKRPYVGKELSSFKTIRLNSKKMLILKRWYFIKLKIEQ